MMRVDISVNPGYLREKAKYEPIVRFVKGQLPVYTYHVEKEDVKIYLDSIIDDSDKATEKFDESTTKHYKKR